MKKRFAEEQIIGILGEVEASGTSIRAAVRKYNITDQTFVAGETSTAAWMYRMPDSSRIWRPRTQSSRSW
jgi:hypothetical protein